MTSILSINWLDFIQLRFIKAASENDDPDVPPNQPAHDPQNNYQALYQWENDQREHAAGSRTTSPEPSTSKGEKSKRQQQRELARENIRKCIEQENEIEQLDGAISPESMSPSTSPVTLPKRSKSLPTLIRLYDNDQMQNQRANSQASLDWDDYLEVHNSTQSLYQEMFGSEENIYEPINVLDLSATKSNIYSDRVYKFENLLDKIPKEVLLSPVKNRKKRQTNIYRRILSKCKKLC